jgi:hypothetical protein
VAQRAFRYSTRYTKLIEKNLETALRDPTLTSVLILAHGVGAIQTSIALDQLYLRLPPESFEKLEIYTFGSATSLWHNPLQASGRLMKHIEHYANVSDWFAITGILRPSDPLKTLEPLNIIQKAVVRLARRTNGYREDNAKSQQNVSGRVITFDRSGHLFNQHYIQPMFEMDSYGQAVMDSNALMDSLITEKVKARPQAPPGTAGRGVPRAPKSMVSRARDGHGDEADIPQHNPGIAGDLRIKDVSRLWQYRNGRIPLALTNTRLSTL